MRRIITILLLSMFPFINTASVLAVDFKDTSNHWAKTYISDLSSLGYLQGYPDGSFLPDKTMTRAEFISVLLRCMNNSPAYGYLHNDNWAEAQVNEGLRQGIVQASEYPGGFKQDGAINRAEAAAMVMRALGNSPDYAFASFKDNNIVNNNPYAGYIKAAQQEGIITGYPDGEFKPYNYITRAQAAIILNRFLGKINYTPSYYDNYPSNISPPPAIHQPSSTRISTLSVDGYRYNPDYVEIYIDNKTSFYYLSDAAIINANLLRIGGINYDLSEHSLSLKLQDDYYIIKGVYWVNNLATLELSKGRQRIGDYWSNLYNADIEAVYDRSGNKITRIDKLEFRENGKSTYFDLGEIEIDIYNNYIILGNTKYRPNRIDIRVIKTNNSKTSWMPIEEIREKNNKLIINCEYDRYYDDYYDDYIDHDEIMFIDENSGEQYFSDEIEIRINNNYRSFTRVKLINRYEFEYGQDIYDLEDSRIRIKGESKPYWVKSTSRNGRFLKIHFE